MRLDFLFDKVYFAFNTSSKEVAITQGTFTCSKLNIKTPEKYLKSVQSQQ